MALRDWVDEFVRGCSAGRLREAYEMFYADDVVVVDELHTEHRGKRAIATQDHAFFGEVELHELVADHILLNGDCATISWTYDITPAAGSRHKLRLTAIQTWVDGKIVHETRHRD